MRVVAGSRKGRSLHAVPGLNTRPTTDKVKEALFNVIGQEFLNGGLGLDLYAGTGGLGIEALSRGLDKVIFVDNNPQAIETIKRNIEALNLQAQTEIYKNDATKALKALIKRKLTLDIIFLDPPYNKQQISSQLAIISDYNLLAEQGIIVVETAHEVALPPQVGGLFLNKERQYGDTKIHIFNGSRG